MATTFGKQLIRRCYFKESLYPLQVSKLHRCGFYWNVAPQSTSTLRRQISSQVTNRNHAGHINESKRRCMPWIHQNFDKSRVSQSWLLRSQHQLAKRIEGDEIFSMSSAPPPPSPPPTSSPNSPPQTSPSQPPLPQRRQPAKKVSNFMFGKFYGFVQGYLDFMEKRFPQAMNVYRVFVVGFKDFSKELAEYVKIKTKAVLNGSSTLSRQELDVYYRMPSEIMRVGPTLLMSALPGFQYIVFPVAYKFPKRLLSSHFWSLQQKSQFAIENQRTRLLNQRPVLRHLQNTVDSVSDSKQRELCKEILMKLGSGSQPSIHDIMKIKPLFQSDPFSLKAIHGPHVKSLCRLHGLHTWFFKRIRLFDRAEMLHILDMTLIREGIFNLKPEELKSACFLRGLNAANTSQEDMVEFLQQWVSVSSALQEHSYSLLLHLPVLIAYNNPNNWALIY